jgi:threonine dehydrogenase-like Zn-dependent dehydrogenase
MKSLVWTAAEKMEFKDIERPRPQINEVLLRVQAVGICGSEIEGYLGHNSLRIPPLVMGHELCGRVEELGEGASAGLLGQKVVVNPLLYCGICVSCRKGLTNLCSSRSIIGVHRSGAFAEWVAVPERALVAIPEQLDAYRASLAEPLACSLRATRRAMVRHPFANVLVIGAGGVGLLCAMVAKLLGASSVTISDINLDRLQASLLYGVDATVNPKKDELATVLRTYTGEKGIDVVIDAAGFQSTRESAMAVINPGGTIMNVGLGIDGTNLRINHLIRSEIEILGSFCYNAQDFHDAVDLLKQGKITEEGWTEIRSMKNGGQAFADLVAGKVTSGKIFLNPQQEV